MRFRAPPPAARRPGGRAVADEAERCIDAAVEQRPEREQDVRNALDRRHAPDPPDHETLLRDAEQATELGSAIAAHALLEVDPEPDDDELLGGSDPERDQIVPNLGPDRDQPRRVPGQRALGLTEEPRADRAEVSAEHVAVVRVDDHGRAGVSRQ